MDARQKPATHPDSSDSRRGARPPVKQQLGHEWSLLLDAEFQRNTADGDIVFDHETRTIYVSIFNTSNTAAEEAIEKMIEGRPGIPVQMFDRDEPGIRGHAYLLPEGCKSNKYWGLNTWTAARGTIACVTIYFREFDDLDWAISLWKSVRPYRESRVAMN